MTHSVTARAVFLMGALDPLFVVPSSDKNVSFSHTIADFRFYLQQYLIFDSTFHHECFERTENLESNQ
jgi:hypothetical protein